MEIFRAVCSGLLTVLLAIKFKEASHFSRVWLVFSTSLRRYNSPPCLNSSCHLLPSRPPPSCSAAIILIMSLCYISESILFSRNNCCEIKAEQPSVLFDKLLLSWNFTAIRCSVLSHFFNISEHDRSSYSLRKTMEFLNFNWLL